MKSSCLSFAFLLSAWSMVAAEIVGPGASLQVVKAELGIPRGEMKRGERHVLYYDRGEIELRNGMLIRMNLRTVEEQEKLVARQERLRKEEETRRMEMMAEGSALRDRKLADPAFLAAPVAYQVAFWEDFVRRYPEVSCAEPLTIARLRLSAQLEDQRRRDIQADRLAVREERYATAYRQPEFYPLYTSSRHSHRHHHSQPFVLGPITYTFYDNPLPPYTTPVGNPAGNLTGDSIFNLKAGNPAVRRQAVQEELRWDRGYRTARQPVRGFATGSPAFRGRS